MTFMFVLFQKYTSLIDQAGDEEDDDVGEEEVEQTGEDEDAAGRRSECL